MTLYGNLARRLLSLLRDANPGRYETRPATPETHPHADWPSYDQALQLFERQGFRHVGDLDVVSIPPMPAAMHPTMVRMFVGGDGAIVAEFSRLALRWTPVGVFGRLSGMGRPFVALSTELSDGRIVVTAAGAGLRQLVVPPWIERELVESGPAIDTLIATLIATHRARLARLPADTAPLRHGTLAEVVAAADRAQRRKLDYRRSVGWATREELGVMSGMNGEHLDQLDAEFRRLIA
jgi:hypothetical protein